MKTMNSELQNLYLKLIFTNQNPKQKKVIQRRALTIHHIRSRKDALMIPFKIKDEWKKINGSSKKKLEFDLKYLKNLGEIIVQEKPYFDQIKNKTIPRGQFIISTFIPKEEETMEQLITAYLASIINE